MTFDAFCSAVVLWCYAYGGSVTRWGSTGVHNAAVGGVPGSPHRFFMGVDVVYGKGGLDGAPNAIVASQRARAMGLALIVEADHHHLQPLDWPAG